jgi:hypothetical protein
MLSRDVLAMYSASDEQLDGLVAQSKAWADGWIDPGDADSLRPHLIVEAKDLAGELQTTMIAADVPFDAALEKKLAMKRFGQMFYQRGEIPLAVAVVADAWVSAESPGKYLLPEDDPKRREAIIVMVSDVSRERLRHAQRFYDRGPGDVIRWQGAWEDAPSNARLRLSLLEHFWEGFWETLPGYGQYMATQKRQADAKQMDLRRRRRELDKKKGRG